MTVQLTIYINYVIGYIHLTICAVDSFVTESWWRTVVVMSFLDIKNHKERDEMIEDYLTLKEKIKKRNLEERSDLIDYQRDLVENFEPVVASNKEMAKEIINELTPITKELQDLNNKAKLNVVPTTGVKRNIDSVLESESSQNNNFGPYTDEFLKKYLDLDTRSSQIDTTFGIRYENGPWMIGDKQIKIDDDDIRIDDETYVGTSGLWSLITSKSPTNYTDDDLQRYKELLYETSALHQHYNSRDPYPRASRSMKWKQILGPIWNEFQMTGMTPPSPMNRTKTSFDDNDDTDSLDGTIVDDKRNNDDLDSDESFHSIGSEGELSKGDGIKMYLQKQGRCFGLERCGNGLKFIPRPNLAGIRGDGLYLRVGSGIYDGKGLILGSKSPFKNIPILGWIS